jgi:hypothetical protein
MASLYEYFVKEGASNLTAHKSISLINATGEALGEFTARLHYDFEAHAKYISFFIPNIPDLTCPEVFALNSVPEILLWPDAEFHVKAGLPGELKDGRELVFTGQIYLWSERPVSEESKQRLNAEAQAAGA